MSIWVTVMSLSLSIEKKMCAYEGGLVSREWKGTSEALNSVLSYLLGACGDAQRTTRPVDRDLG